MAQSDTWLLAADLMGADLPVFLVVGVLAGAHCLGMCGPLVTLYGDHVDASRDRRRTGHLTLRAVRQHVLFNLGRASSYALVGAAAGLLGAVVFDSAAAVQGVGDGLRGAVGVLVGMLVVAVGVSYLLGGAGALHRFVPGGGPFGRLVTVATNRVDRLAAGPGIAGLGALHGLFPCPIIYPAYLYAFAVGDPVRGGLSLLVLGLGTVPTLLLYGLFLDAVGVAHRRRLHRALGVAFVVLGYLLLAHGLMLFGVHVPHPTIPHRSLSHVL
ncbi:sulfite exporter TauE/SafE family protein [Halobacteria archaeon HArc-gm2]|nr:sulfite exporter TauE/SafE family protein [Halobacteria archaeon HArc-gm2]